MLKSVRIKIFTSIKFSFSVTSVESDERHQNDICDDITAHGDNIITPEFLPRVPQEQESQEMNEINKETRTADQQITRMDQETNRTDQAATRIEEECAMTIQERNNRTRINTNRNDQDGAGAKYGSNYTITYRNGSRIRASNSNGQ